MVYSRTVFSTLSLVGCFSCFGCSLLVVCLTPLPKKAFVFYFPLSLFGGKMRSFSSLFSLRPCFFSPLPFQRQITTTSSLYNPSKAPPQHKSPSHHNKNKTKKPQSHQNQNNYNHKSHNHNHNHNNPHQQKHQQNKHPFQRPLGPNNPNPFQLVQEVKKDEEVPLCSLSFFPFSPFSSPSHSCPF